MAYAFEKIEGLLNPNKGFALADEQGQGQSAGLSSNTGGDIGPATGSGSATTAYEAQPSTSAASRGVLSKNKGQTQSPIDIKRLGSQIEGSTKSLQSEANAYTANATRPYEQYTDVDGTVKNYANDYGVPSEGLQSLVSDYVGSGATAKRGLEPYPGAVDGGKTWYDLATSAPLDPGAFKPTTSTDFRGVSDLQSGAGGIRNLFQSSGGARYTPGMASMDTSLLLQDPSFATAAEDITKSVGGLKNLESDLLDNLPKTAREKTAKAQRNLKDAVEGAARGDREKLTDEQRAEVTAPVKYTDYTSKSGDIKGQIIADNPELKPYIDSLGEDGFNNLIRQATKPGSRSSLNWEDYIDSDEAERFNRIEGLLGSGKTYVKGNRGGKDSEFDLEALKGLLRSGSSNHKPTVIDNLPSSTQSSGSGAAPGPSGIPTRTGRYETGDNVTNWTVETPLGPVTVAPPIKPSRDGAIDFAKDVLAPTVATNRELTRGLSIPDNTWQGKIINGAEDLASGPGSSVAMSAPPAAAINFPNVQNILGGGKSSTYEGNPDVAKTLNGINLPALEPVNTAPAPVKPNTPTVDFSGGYGSGNAGTPDKPKMTEETKKMISRLLRF